MLAFPNVLTTLALAVIVAGAAVGVPGGIQGAPVRQGPNVGQDVIDALQTSDEVEVDIALAPPQALTARPVDLPSVRAAVAAAVDDVLAGLSASDFRLGRRFAAVPVITGAITRDGLDRLLRNPRVLRIDLPAGGTGGLAQSVPLIDADEMHSSGFTGAGVVVAVLDTGLDTDHPQLGNDLLSPQECFSTGPDGVMNGVGGCPNGTDRQSGTGAAEDGHGHGTNVTGIITSTGGSGFGVGVAPDAEIVAYKVLDNSSTFYSFTNDIVGALDDIIVNRPEVDVINMSLGTGALFTGNCDASTAFNIAGASAIDTLRASGRIAFASSHNNSSGTHMTSPACLSNVISVGAVWDAAVGSVTLPNWCTDATTVQDQVTCFTNSNSTTDVMAPGAPATSTGLFGGTSTYYGTSQASPHAAGCAALFLQETPGATPAQIETRLESSAVLVTDTTNGLSFPRIDCSPLASLPVGGLAELVALEASPKRVSRGSGLFVGSALIAFAAAMALAAGALSFRRHQHR